METKIIKIDQDNLDHKLMQEAGDLIAAGELVAFPTETVYGLGGDALDPEASKKIYSAKGRPSDNPLIVHISDFSDLERIAKTVPEDARKLSDAFWPGPLTMIVEKGDAVPVCHNRRHGHSGCAHAESSYSARSYKKKRLPYRGAKRQHIRQTEPYRGCTCG